MGTRLGIANQDFYFIGVVLIGIPGVLKIGLLLKSESARSGIDFQIGSVGTGDRKGKVVPVLVGGVEVVQISGRLRNLDPSVRG